MLLRLSAAEINEIIPKHYNASYRIEYTINEFYIEHAISFYGVSLKNACKLDLLNDDNYILNVKDNTGDSRTKGGKLGKKDYHLIRKELDVIKNHN